MTPRPTSRLLLLPHGWPSGEDRERAAALLLGAGGDLERAVDGPNDALLRFVRHVSRMDADASGMSRSIVLLWKTTPLTLTVMQSRRTLERCVPDLGRAAWLVYSSSQLDPFFFEAANRLGDIDGDPADGYRSAPTWHGPEGKSYLLVGPETDPEALKARFYELALEESSVSGMRRLVSSLAHVRRPLLSGAPSGGATPV